MRAGYAPPPWSHAFHPEPGPVVTLAAAALVGAGLLTADVLTDPARTRAETAPVAAAPRPTATPAARPQHDGHGRRPRRPPPHHDQRRHGDDGTDHPAYAAAYLAPRRSTSAGTPRRRTSVAVAVRDGKVAAYVCDGKSVESWLTGTAVRGPPRA